MIARALSHWLGDASLTEQSDRPSRADPVWLFATRLLKRDIASGRLLIMLLATTIAVASTSAVNLLVSRVKVGMVAESSALLAGDLALTARDMPPARYAELATRHNLQVAQIVSLQSVVAFGEQLQLVRLKAVDEAYPLRGDLQVAAHPFAENSRSLNGPPSGEVWADLRLYQALGLKTGDAINVGQSTFTVSRVLVLEPVRGGNLFAFAPRVMMNRGDLENTGLIVSGSRVSHTSFFAGNRTAVQRFRDELDLAAGHTLHDPRSARPEIERSFVQAERFLTLAAFVGVLLATIGIALAADGYTAHHEKTVAIFKTLGLTSRSIGQVLAVELLLLAIVATVVGDALALGVHGILIGQFLPAAAVEQSGLSLAPLLHGLWVSTIALAGFALPTLVQLTRMPVTAVLSRDQVSIKPRLGATLVSMLAAIVLIAPWHLGNTKLVAITLAGMLTSAAAVAACALLLVRLLGRLRRHTAMGWRFGLANIARRARLSVTQATALGLGIAVILLLGIIRDDLHGQWQSRLPNDAPNHFLINIQGDEVPALKTRLDRETGGDVRFYPMVRGRLTAINQTAVNGDSYVEPRARRLVEREFNLSSAVHMKKDNRIVGGSWWEPSALAQMSVEEGIAERLGIQIGDELTFQVADRRVVGQVSSLRHVDWDNFEVNFFVVATPDLLAGAPTTYITSFYLPPRARTLMPDLVKQFPSITVIDVDALMVQVRRVMERVSTALQWVFGFAMLAGVFVLIAAVQTSQRERVLDIILLKTLGASRRFITATVTIEFAVLGALAGLLGSLGAMGTGWLLAHFVLTIPYRPDSFALLAGIGGGIAGVTVLGVLVARHTQGKSVVQSLQDVG